MSRWRWTPDTCDCILTADSTGGTLKDFKIVQRCQIHKDAKDGNALKIALQKHNGDPKFKGKDDEESVNKREAEKKRIRDIGDPDEFDDREKVFKIGKVK